MSNSLHYRLALDALPQLVWVAAPDGTLEYLNRRCADYTGLPIDDLLGWDWGWVVHPADLPHTLRVWTESVRNGAPHEVEQRLRRHDGEYRWFLCRAEPSRGADGAVARWFGTCTDVDDFRRRADSHQATQGLFRGLVERCHDGLVLAEVDGRVRYANPAAEFLLGLAAGELVGADLWGLVAPEDAGTARQWLGRVLGRPGERSSLVALFPRRGGGSRCLEVLATSLIPDPGVRGVVVQLLEVNGWGAPTRSAPGGPGSPVGESATTFPPPPRD